MSPEDFLSLSKRLCESQDEIDLRSSISRAYYGAYHAACDTAMRLQLPEAKRYDAGMHERLISRFECNGPGLRKIARRLRDRKRLRAMADYQLGEQVTREEASLNALESARLVQDLTRIGCAAEKQTDN